MIVEDIAALTPMIKADRIRREQMGFLCPNTQ
jgi:hypothetical protein